MLNNGKTMEKIVALVKTEAMYIKAPKFTADYPTLGITDLWVLNSKTM